MSTYSACGLVKKVNVGSIDCDAARQYPQKLTIGGYAFSTSETSDTDTFKAALLAAHLLDSSSALKLLTINNIVDPNDSTPANKTGQVGEGPTRVIVEGKPTFTYKVEIGQALYKELRKLNKRNVPVYTYDDAGNEWGAIDRTANTFVGALAQFFISDNRQTTSSAPVSATITLSYLSATQYNDDAYFMPVDLGAFEPAGLLNANLSFISNASNVFKIGVNIPTAQFNTFINLADKYTTAWVGALFTAATGLNFATSLAITSVAYDATNHCLTVTFDSTAYTALTAGAKIKLSTVNVAGLTAALITSVEGNPVILTK